MTHKLFSTLAVLLLLAGVLSACGSQTPDPFQVTFTVTPAPPVVGDGQLTFSVTDSMNKPIDDLSIEISMGMTSMQMSAQSGSVERIGPGLYKKDVTFHTKGKYAIQVYFNRGGRTLLQKEFKFSVN